MGTFVHITHSTSGEFAMIKSKRGMSTKAFSCTEMQFTPRHSFLTEHEKSGNEKSHNSFSDEKDLDGF